MKINYTYTDADLDYCRALLGLFTIIFLILATVAKFGGLV